MVWMSDEPNQPNPSGPEGDRPRKRRRRRRNKNKNKGGEAGTPPQNQAADGTPTPNETSDTSGSPQGESQQPRNKRKPRSRDGSGERKPAGDGYRGKPKSEGPRDGGGRPPRSSDPKRDTGPNRKGGAPAAKGGTGSGPNAGGGSGGNAGGPPAKKKKRRKPRTKQCVNCFTPCTTIHRVRLDYRKQWVFICDICWPSRCIDNPHYEFGGTWVSGRIVKPESQQRDEKLAKQGHKSPRPTENAPTKPDSAAPAVGDTSATAVAEPPPSSENGAKTDSPERPEDSA